MYNVVIIAAVDFPVGGGESTRLKTLASAIKSAGNDVTILLENPSGNVDEDLLQSEGAVEGIPFKYVLGNTKALKGRRFFTSKYRAVKLLSVAISAMHRTKKIDVLWLNQLAFHTIYPLTRLSKQLNIRIVHSYEDERMRGAGLKRQLIYANQILADRFLTRSADAIVVISRYLKAKYVRLTNGDVPVVIIPTIINVRQWDVGVERQNEVPVLLYYGGFFGFDEIEKIVLSVKVLKERGQKVKLYMIGYNRKKPDYMRHIAELITSTRLSEEIEMKGFMPHHNLIEYLRESNVLIGLRKHHEWSQSGLSTKLSEYLSTGRLVICSAIGDNTHYLKNGDSAVLLASDCTVEHLADAIENVIEDPDSRRKIGAAGRHVALNQFDVTVIRETINKMLEKIMHR